MDLSDLAFLYVPTIAAVAVGAGLVGGLLFIFSNTIMGSLDELDSATAISAMQTLNRRIVNPLFLLAFVGTALASVGVIGYLVLCNHRESQEIWAGIAGLVYLLGVLGITGGRNIPLNNQLDEFDPGAGDSSTVWDTYNRRWSAWNNARTLFAVVAAISAAVALAQG